MAVSTQSNTDGASSELEWSNVLKTTPDIAQLQWYSCNRPKSWEPGGPTVRVHCRTFEEPTGSCPGSEVRPQSFFRNVSKVDLEK